MFNLPLLTKWKYISNRGAGNTWGALFLYFKHSWALNFERTRENREIFTLNSLETTKYTKIAHTSWNLNYGSGNTSSTKSVRTNFQKFPKNFHLQYSRTFNPAKRHLGQNCGASLYNFRMALQVEFISPSLRLVCPREWATLKKTNPWWELYTYKVIKGKTICKFFNVKQKTKNTCRFEKRGGGFVWWRKDIVTKVTMKKLHTYQK